jgi:hypothetical protein
MANTPQQATRQPQVPERNNPQRNIDKMHTKASQTSFEMHVVLFKVLFLCSTIDSGVEQSFFNSLQSLV